MTKKTNKSEKTKKKVTQPVKLYLDLGCGENCQVHADGTKFKGVDKFKVPGVDIVFDLMKFPWTFAKNASVDEVFCSHFVEHLTGEQRIHFFNELYRILKPGGKARIITPYYLSSRAIQDPTHQWPPICEASYLYWQKNFREANKLDHYLGSKCDFTCSVWYTMMTNQKGEVPINGKNDDLKAFMMLHYHNIIADMVADLVKI